MELILYNFSKRVNSTARPSSGGTSVNVTLKHATSVTNPIFILTGNIEELSMYSYAKWNDNYYFIRDITLGRNELIQISMTIDWLATYKTEIGNYTAFVERAASLYNPLLDDSALSKTYEVRNTVSAKGVDFPNVVPGGCYLIRTTGQAQVGNSIGITTYALYANEVNQVLNFLFTDGNFDFLSDTSVKSFFNPFQYIIDCQWYPFAASYFGRDTDTFKLGWWDSGVTCFVVSEYSIGYSTIVPIPSGSYTDFRRYSSEYTSLSVYLPGSGLYNLNPCECSGDFLTATYIIDVATGETEIRLTKDDFLVGNFCGKMSASIAIGQLSVDVLETAGKWAGGFGNILTGKLGEGLVDIITGTKTALQPTQSVNGSGGNITSILRFPYIETYLIEYGTASYPLAVYGRPLMQNQKINTLSGYVKCGNASINVEATEGGKTAINNYLNGGFYYE